MGRAARPATAGRPLIPFLKAGHLEGLTGADRPRPEMTGRDAARDAREWGQFKISCKIYPICGAS
jgi:hypothetical protein